MRIELKNVKYAKFASEETHCFQATVYLNGVKSGVVSNDGHGGANMYDPWSLEEKLEAYAKTLPLEDAGFPDPHDPSKPCMMQPNAEIIIGNLMNEFLARRDFDRDIKKRVLWLSTDGCVYSTKRTLTPTDIEHYMTLDAATLKRKIPDMVKLLNALPREEAFAVYRNSGA